WSDLNALDDNGQTITYSVREATVAGYTPEIKLESQSDTEFVYSVTNKHDVEKVNAQVTKIWNDDNNRDGIRPESVQVKLVRTDGVAVENSEKTLKASNNWTASWTDLDKLSGGKEIEYKVEEVTVPNGYTASYGAMTKIGDNTYGFTVTNNHEVEKTSVNVKKEWADDGNRDGLHTDGVTEKLQADGVDVPNSTVTLNSGNSWAHTWDNLTKYRDGGQLIKYTVVEENVPAGYTESYSGDAATGITVINTHHETTKASVEKIWSDSDNRDGKRPSSVTVQLMADGTAYGDPVVLQDGAWTHEWTDLPVHKNDAGDIKDINYTLVETETGGYKPSIALNRGQDNSWNFTVTNSYEAEETSMSVVKVWQDDGNRDGIRPTEIKVRLLADGEQYGDEVTLKGDAWAHTWTELPKYKDGKEITYTVEELNKDALERLGYTSTVTAEGKTSYKIVNAYDSKRTAVSVKKVWNDDSNREGVRPQTVVVELLANGTVEESVELEGDAWSHTWNNLPVNENGKKITYSVREVVPDGYRLVSIVEDPDYSFTITNKHDIQTVGVSATKVWDDDDNRDVVRPVSVDVNLKADGTVIDTKTLNAENGWTYNWTEQPKFSAK
ncbi:MAG: Cna B-type domain-containing protein, partial [Eggerthellaceae bacterium]|nr:Cna B-type domain-containing protein [Eggerthellaceae bacterium]